mmetsp:Transcript_5099/g.11818  ORF Transcript_5099/g.11818 Transcript_5099/m.11818 type:complete len:93 (+) Transcript_5099:150-428(+)
MRSKTEHWFCASPYVTYGTHSYETGTTVLAASHDRYRSRRRYRTVRYLDRGVLRRRSGAGLNSPYGFGATVRYAPVVGSGGCSSYGFDSIPC